MQIPLARRRGRGLSFVAVDIDHFKEVNDTYGHAVGDRVIVGVTDLMRAACRSADLPVRLGGEEFLFVVAEGDIDGAMAFADRLRRAIAEHPFVLEGVEGTVCVTVSIGVAVFGLHGEDADTLLRAADEALYRSKRGGRDRVTLSDRLIGLRTDPLGTVGPGGTVSTS